MSEPRTWQLFEADTGRVLVARLEIANTFWRRFIGLQFRRSLAADSVGSDELADGAVDTAAVQSGAVTSAKIAANTLGAADVAANALGNGAFTDGGGYAVIRPVAHIASRENSRHGGLQ